MSWVFKGPRLFYDPDEIGQSRICVAEVPDGLKITGVQELIRIRAFNVDGGGPGLGRTFTFDPSTGMLWEEGTVR